MPVVINGGGGKPKKKPPLPVPPTSPLPVPQLSPADFERLRNAVAGGPGPTGATGQQPSAVLEPRRPLRLPDAPVQQRPQLLTDLRASLGRLSGGPAFDLPAAGGRIMGQRGIVGLIGGLLGGGERRIASQLPPASVTGVGFDPTPPPAVTTPQSPFALEAGLFHQARQFVVRKIFEAINTSNRNRLPGEITNVIAALLPWRDWGFSSYQEALKALGYTEIPGAGTWIKDEEITSSTVGGASTNTGQAVQQGSFNIGGGGAIRSPQFSTLINWRI